MSPRYAEWSDSQLDIGRELIDTAERLFAAHAPSRTVRLIDVACGPGTLTKQLVDRLQSHGIHIEVSALDHDPAMLASTARKLPGCRTYQQSFHVPLCGGQQFDLIFSNEGLHWIPSVLDEHAELLADTPRLLREQFGNRFVTIGNQLLTASLSNLHQMTAANGYAVLQFGRKGQLDKLWQLVDDTLHAYGVSGVACELLFPLYYPDETDLFNCIHSAGFSVVEAHLFQQSLSEKTATGITGFLRGFSEHGLQKILPSGQLDRFYQSIEDTLSRMNNLRNFRQGQWNRSILVLHKP
ncbi:methyltransferase domain-containing protein [Mariprofundus ferrooxydans]|nr:methyltransferase domain-containing protein [Mariprofundus ferrooxydans]